MPNPAQEVLTLKQFLQMPEVKPALEFIRGRMAQKVSPNLHHSVIDDGLLNAINRFARPKIGRSFVELRCSFGGESYVPDVSFFRKERIPKDERGRYAEKVLIPPDLSIEILSPGQTVANLSARITRCLAKGVRLGWLIQPRRSRVFVFRPGEPRLVLEIGDTLSGDDVIPGFTLPLAELFGWLQAEE
ncbi:MAG: hypothetical protein JWN86_638 [Planctomycetota bacterium]|nr:hypothetical protein [Planctomycetota bacterium]